MVLLLELEDEFITWVSILQHTMSTWSIQQKMRATYEVGRRIDGVSVCITHDNGVASTRSRGGLSRGSRTGGRRGSLQSSTNRESLLLESIELASRVHSKYHAHSAVGSREASVLSTVNPEGFVLKPY